MLKPLRHCACCGKELVSVRSTKAYCDDACRKRAARGSTEQQIESRWIVECLRRMRLVGKIWPVYSWDDSPPIWALLVRFDIAFNELNLGSIALVTEADLKRAFRDCDVAIGDAAGDRLKAAIKAFYDARKDRRIRKG
jgi:hypothetical protein